MRGKEKWEGQRQWKRGAAEKDEENSDVGTM